ncbi:Anionic trypsin-1 [Armadillidium vulgare]|nr:Anionic trypsin-1 [Armadillidium vulgare]
MRIHKVVAGEDNMEEQSGSEQFVNVTNIIIHEDFSSFSHKNDIAILKVSPQFRINKNVAPVDLKPYVAENYIGEDCNIHGWKITEQKGFVSPVLRQKMIEIISDLECHKMYPGLIRLRSNICGLNVGFQTTCYDSLNVDGDLRNTLNANVVFLSTPNVDLHNILNGDEDIRLI